MSDVYLAERLHAYARHSYDLAFQANQTHYGAKTPLAAGLIAQAAHFALLAFAVSTVTIEDPIDEAPRSLSDLARSIAATGIRQFEPDEIEAIAHLDTIHLRPVTKVLLQDYVPERMFSNTQAFVDRLVRSLDDHLRALKEEAQ